MARSQKNKNMKKLLLIIAVTICISVVFSSCGNQKPKSLTTATIVEDSIFGKEFSLTVDYSLSFEQMVGVGVYDFQNAVIHFDDFPTPVVLVGKKIEIKARLFHFDQDVSSEDAIKQLNKKGYRLASSFELLTVGKKYPDWQCYFPIIAFGSIWRDTTDFTTTYLDCEHGKRWLTIDGCNNNWSKYSRFLAIRK